MALQQAPSSARLDMICTMPIHIQFKNNDAFFRRVRGILSAGTALRVVQFVDMEDVSTRTDSFCRSLCYLLGLGKQIRYEFYEFRASRTGYVYLIRDALMLQYLREPFSREVYLLETADPALVGRYCAAADAYIRDRLPLAQAPNLQQLRRQQYFLDYFTQPHGRCLLRHMQPFFLPEPLRERFLSRHPELRQELQLFLGSAEFFETIFLYQLALVDYIYTGRLHFLGTVIDVPPEARREHLRSMIEQLRRTPERLCILCTQNRVCNYDDLSVSVFVNQHAAFVLDGASGGAQPAYTVSSGAMVHQLNVWMDHFRKLPAAQRLTGQDAIDYLTRCMRLL